jgi:signal transduction histidine kinase/HAMP domain-containing protein
MSIKSRQVAGVTSLVVFIVASLSAYHLATLARLSIKETESRGELLRQAIFQRAREVVPTAKDPYAALQQDGGLRSLLESSGAFSGNVTYAAIVNREGIAVAHNFSTEEGKPIPDQEELTKILDLNALTLLRTLYYDDRTFEIRQPLLFGEQEFGTIKIGVSTLLVKSELQSAFRVAAQSVVLALLMSTAVAMLMAQWMLRPINVIQSGLTRLGRGELDVRLDLPEGEEFKDLGSSFATISAQLSESRAKASSPSDFESIVDNLEDAVALFSPDGRLIFSNPAMGVVLPEFAGDGARRLDDMGVANDAVRSIIERTLASHQAQGPLSVEHGGSDRLLMTHPIDDGQGRFVGAMLVARNLAFMTQVHSTLNYSRKLAALGRLMAGVAHEVKNPLNAMTIHLELLKQKLNRQLVLAGTGARGSSGAATEPDADRRRTGVADAPAGRAENPDVIRHVDTISKEIQRLDLVLTGFLKFARPDELKLQPVQLSRIISDVVTTVSPEADHKGVTLKPECPRDLPEVNADPAMLRQALLNLALNGCQAMPDGGTLKIACRPASGRRVEIDVEDTGVGIAPENLQKIFDLYFTTKEKGTGIGLSMVYRIVQLHDGEIEVQSTPGRGTRFRLVFPQA